MSVRHIWRGAGCRGRRGGWTGRSGAMGRGDFYAKGDGDGGQEGGGMPEMMECQSGHTFPEQRRVTQLVVL